MRNRLRQRAIVSLLKTNDSPPKILASQLFFLFDVKPHINSITDYMTVDNVLVEVGNILRSKQRLQEDVGEWARDLFKQAGLSFVENSAADSIDCGENSLPVPGLSVVSFQPATSRTEAQSSPKRKTRRIYLSLAIQYLEKGSCTHKDLVDAIMKQFPNLTRETVSTFVSDVQNPRYSPIKDRKVVKQADGTLIFKDKIKPVLTVIENSNYVGTEIEAESVTEQQVSGGDL